MALLDVLTYLIVVLVVGTVFAWFEFYQVYRSHCTTCMVGRFTSPFFSKCFVGAVFFSIALILALYAYVLVRAL